MLANRIKMKMSAIIKTGSISVGLYSNWLISQEINYFGQFSTITTSLTYKDQDFDCRMTIYTFPGMVQIADTYDYMTEDNSFNVPHEANGTLSLYIEYYWESVMYGNFSTSTETWNLLDWEYPRADFYNASPTLNSVILKNGNPYITVPKNSRSTMYTFNPDTEYDIGYIPHSLSIGPDRIKYGEIIYPVTGVTIVDSVITVSSTYKAGKINTIYYSNIDNLW